RTYCVAARPAHSKAAAGANGLPTNQPPSQNWIVPYVGTTGPGTSGAAGSTRKSPHQLAAMTAAAGSGGAVAHDAAKKEEGRKKSVEIISRNRYPIESELDHYVVTLSLPKELTDNQWTPICMLLL